MPYIKSVFSVKSKDSNNNDIITFNYTYSTGN